MDRTGQSGVGSTGQRRQDRRDNGHRNKMDWFGLIGRKKKTSAMSTHRINTSYKFNMPTMAL